MFHQLSSQVNRFPSNADVLRVLVVEDETPVALLIEDMLEQLGHVIAGTAASVQEALQFVDRGGFDFAFLDINLAGQKAEPVAEALQHRGVPFAFVSGYGSIGVRADLQPVAVIQKPFRAHDLQTALEKRSVAASGNG